MTKAQLIDAVAERTRLPRRDASRALEGTLRVIEDALREGEDVTLSGFGRFHVSERTARAGVNPRTGESMQVPATLVARFTAGSALKKAIRG